MPARIFPDRPIPSIENELDLQPHENLEEDERSFNLSAPVFINEGVLVGFWFTDATGRAGHPVYCLVNSNFEYAYLEGTTFILVRWIDFDPFNVFGDWMGDDTEDNEDDSMSPEEVKGWVITMWMSRKYVGNWTMTAEEDQLM